MSSNEVEEFIKKNGVTKCPQDPALNKRTGYELAAKYGGSGMARAAVQAYELEEWKKKQAAKTQHANAKHGSKSINGFSSKKEKIKAERRRNKNWMKKMAKDPATSKQLAFLRASGMKHGPRLNKAQAHHLIATCVRLEKENDRRIRMAMERDSK